MSLSVRVSKNFRPGADSAGFALDVEFTAERGITVLFGPSGAGKSLTLDCIAGFEKPDAGRVMLSDRILFDAAARVNLRPQDRQCGYVFQSHALFPHMTVRENLMFAAERRPRLESQVLVSVSDDAVQTKTADFTYNLKTPLKAVPVAGAKISLSGTYASYTQTPLMITMSDGEEVAKKAPAKAPVKKAAPARRKG